MTVTLSALYVLLGLGALLQTPVERGRLALVGLTAYAVAMASYSVIPGSQDPQVIAAAARASGAAFFGVNTGLLLLGALLAARQQCRNDWPSSLSSSPARQME